MQGVLARRETSEVVSQLLLAAEGLSLPEDRLLTFVEGAQVCLFAAALCHGIYWCILG